MRSTLPLYVGQSAFVTSPFDPQKTLHCGRFCCSVVPQISRISKLATCSKPAYSKLRSKPPPPEKSERDLKPCCRCCGINFSGFRIGLLILPSSCCNSPLIAAFFLSLDRVEISRYHSRLASDILYGIVFSLIFVINASPVQSIAMPVRFAHPK